MGSDDLFKKRKARLAEDLKRTREKREPYDKVLIVCEGEKTEPLYLTALRDHLKLSSANIVIDPDSDSSPTSVVAYAKKLITENKDDPFDRVFCVIDRDRHADFERAMAQIEGFKSKTTKIEAVVSIPCFEYWLLLHFVYTTKAFGVSGDSPCLELIHDELRQYLPNYEKGDGTTLKSLAENQLDTAIAYAKQVAKSGIDNPSTQMYELVEYLRSLSSNINNAMKETNYLMASSKNKERLLDSLAHAKEGKTVEKALLEE